MSNLVLFGPSAAQASQDNRAQAARAAGREPSSPVVPFEGAPPSVIGAVIAWLATDPEAMELSGKTIEAQQFAVGVICARIGGRRPMQLGLSARVQACGSRGRIVRALA